MNEFANLRSELIKEKDVKVQAFAKYCGYDRANLYKILKGQRTPLRSGDRGKGSQIYASASFGRRKAVGIL